MANRAQDATWRLARMALARNLEKLFSSRSIDPDEAIAVAVGSDRATVKASRFLYHLGQGIAAGIPAKGLKWPAVVVLLQADEGIRPGMEMLNASLWAFLRGELTPNVGISELLDHHLARVNFTRVATVQDFLCRLAARAEIEMFSEAFPLVVARTSAVDISVFFQSSIPVTDKLTIAMLLYVKAYLGGDPFRAAHLEEAIRAFGDSGTAKRAFGKCTGELWVEIENRLFKGQLPYSYGHRFTEDFRLAWPCDILLPSEGTERAMDIFIKVGLAGVKVAPDW